MEPKPARVAISNYHGGQIVTPCVEAQYEGRGRGQKVRVTLRWHDASISQGPGGLGAAVEFLGTVTQAEQWLHAQGVRLDAQGIH